MLVCLFFENIFANLIMLAAPNNCIILSALARQPPKHEENALDQKSRLNIKHDYEEIYCESQRNMKYYDKSLMFHKQNHKKDTEAPCVLSFLCGASAVSRVAFSFSAWTKNCRRWKLVVHGLDATIFIYYLLMLKKCLMFIFKYIPLNKTEETLINKVSPETKRDMK